MTLPRAERDLLMLPASWGLIGDRERERERERGERGRGRERGNGDRERRKREREREREKFCTMQEGGRKSSGNYHLQFYNNRHSKHLESESSSVCVSLPL